MSFVFPSTVLLHLFAQSLIVLGCVEQKLTFEEGFVILLRFPSFDAIRRAFSGKVKPWFSGSNFCRELKLISLVSLLRSSIEAHRGSSLMGPLLYPLSPSHCWSSHKSRCYPPGEMSPTIDKSPSLTCHTPSDLSPHSDLLPPSPLTCHLPDLSSPNWHVTNTSSRCTAMVAAKYLGLWGQISSL